MKVVIIVIAIISLLALLLLAGLLFAGYRYSWGPFYRLSKVRLKRLPGNDKIYDIDNVAKLQDSKLEGLNIIYLGSSVTFGAMSLETSFVEYIAKRNNNTYVKEAASGTTLVDSSLLSYVSRLKKIKEDKADIFVCQLSTNDASQNKELGEISITNKDTGTIIGAINYIIDYVRDRYDCPILFYTNPYYESDRYKAMVDALNAIKEERDISVLDLYSDKEFNDITQKQRKLYMADDIHPTKAGYLKWWTPLFEKALSDVVLKKEE